MKLAILGHGSVTKALLPILEQDGRFDVAGIHTLSKPAAESVEAFLDDMPKQYADADLVLARSGSTVAELCAAGKPSLLVPFAAAADAHQMRNAEAMVAAGAAVMLEEPELAEPSRLVETLEGCYAIRSG